MQSAKARQNNTLLLITLCNLQTPTPNSEHKLCANVCAI